MPQPDETRDAANVDRSPQHPATNDAWAWLDAYRDTLDSSRIAAIESSLRDISSVFWAWEREANHD